MYVTCLEQQSFCHALRKNLKFKLLYFQNKECCPAENKQADGNLYFLLCDEDKNPKLCLVMNFSFLWRHVKTKNTCLCFTFVVAPNKRVVLSVADSRIYDWRSGNILKRWMSFAVIGTSYKVNFCTQLHLFCLQDWNYSKGPEDSGYEIWMVLETRCLLFFLRGLANAVRIQKENWGHTHFSLKLRFVK